MFVSTISNSFLPITKTYKAQNNADNTNQQHNGTSTTHTQWGGKKPSVYINHYTLILPALVTKNIILQHIRDHLIPMKTANNE